MIRNLESLFDYRKNFRVIILMFFSVVVLFSFTSNIVYGAGVSEGCGIFDIKSGCDLSGWMHLVIDVAATGLLALFLHSLASKHTKKLELIITNIPKIALRISIGYSILNILAIFKYLDEIIKTKAPPKRVRIFMKDERLSII